VGVAMAADAAMAASAGVDNPKSCFTKSALNESSGAFFVTLQKMTRT
jgi:hypothetical protein